MAENSFDLRGSENNGRHTFNILKNGQFITSLVIQMAVNNYCAHFTIESFGGGGSALYDKKQALYKIDFNINFVSNQNRNFININSVLEILNIQYTDIEYYDSSFFVENNESVVKINV
jgi:hypothetical protein